VRLGDDHVVHRKRPEKGKVDGDDRHGPVPALLLLG